MPRQPEEYHANEWLPIGKAPNMRPLWTYSAKYSKGGRHAYQDLTGRLRGINANGTDGELPSDPTHFQYLSALPNPEDPEA